MFAVYRASVVLVHEQLTGIGYPGINDNQKFKRNTLKIYVVLSYFRV